MELKELLPQIKPKIDKESDKYSWQLYQFVKRKRYMNVYVNKEDHNNGQLDKCTQRDIIIGSKLSEHNKAVNGNHLSKILSPDRDKYSEWHYLDKRLGWDLIDITDEFWDKYISDGRCTLDREHRGCWIGGDHRYSIMDEETRKCNWCGKVFKKHFYTETITKEKWEEE